MGTQTTSVISGINPYVTNVARDSQLGQAVYIIRYAPVEY